MGHSTRAIASEVMDTPFPCTVSRRLLNEGGGHDSNRLMRPAASQSGIWASIVTATIGRKAFSPQVTCIRQAPVTTTISNDPDTASELTLKHHARARLLARHRGYHRRGIAHPHGRLECPKCPLWCRCRPRDVPWSRRYSRANVLPGRWPMHAHRMLPRSYVSSGLSVRPMPGGMDMLGASMGR